MNAFQPPSEWIPYYKRQTRTCEICNNIPEPNGERYRILEVTTLVNGFSLHPVVCMTCGHTKFFDATTMHLEKDNT